MLVSMVGAGAASTEPWAKASIVGRGAEKDTFNVHLWSGEPGSRERLNVPVELLRDARSLEEQESQQRLAWEEADRRARQQAEDRRLAAEAARQAAQRAAALREEALRRDAERAAEVKRQAAESARLKAIQEAERKALEEAKRQAEEEAQKRAAEEAAEKQRRNQEEEEAKRREEEEMERRERQQMEQRTRKTAMKAKWESVKAAKLKILRAENASKDVQRMLLQSEHFKEQQKMSARVALHQQIQDVKAEDFVKPAAGDKTGKLRIRVRDVLGKETAFTVLRTTPFKGIMRKACDRLDLQSQQARFFWKGKVISPSDSGVSLAMRNGGLFEVRAPRVRHEGRGP